MIVQTSACRLEAYAAASSVDLGAEVTFELHFSLTGQ